VEKRADPAQGNRYLLELEVKDWRGQSHRLSHYVYTLVRQSRPRPRKFPRQRPAPEVILCNPFGFQWNPTATVHLIVPGNAHTRSRTRAHAHAHTLNGILSPVTQVYAL